jgi:D-tyrosyl-tRNA(Tyr) deacylase
LAQSLYQSVADRIAADGIPVARGRFAAHMDVELVNDGPVTFIIQTCGGSLVGP